MPEVVYVQHLMGIEGVIVDLVREITEAILDFTDPTKQAVEALRQLGKEGKIQFETLIPAQFSADNLTCSVTVR